MKEFSWIKAIVFCGACIAFYIGAGFATMQEVMQYDASYGSRFWIVIAVTALIYVYTNLSFATNGNRLKLLNGGDIYRVYCGKFIGTFFECFSAFFCYMCFIVMCGGANSTAMQQWGLPNGVGAVILAVAAVGTVILGLNGILKALGKLGPIIVILIMIIAAYGTINGFAQVEKGFELIDNAAYKIEQVGDGNPFASGASYGGFVILWFATFLSEIGAKNNLKSVNTGMLLSTICIFGTAILCSIALIANIDITWNASVPALVLAQGISSAFAGVFAVVIFLGIYTSAVPLLWTGIRKLADDGTTKYKLLTVFGGVAGCIVACFFPYGRLLNVLYGLNGYLGFVLVAFMLVNDCKLLLKK